MNSITTQNRGRIVSMIRRHPLGAFLGWFFTVGQAIAFTPLIARKLYDVDLNPQVFIVVTNLIGLVLPALVITRLVDGSGGLRRLRTAITRVRVPLRWYAVPFIAVPLATVAITVALFGLPHDLTAGTLGSALTAGLLVQLVLVFVTNNWWEEVGWTGFVQARLQRRHGPVRAALITAPLFALQHLSLAVDNTLLGAVVFIVFATAMAIPFRLLLGWVYNRSRSLVVVGLVHAAGDAMTTGSGFIGAGFLVSIYADPAVSPMHLLASAGLGLLALAATRGRLGRSRKALPTADPAQPSDAIVCSPLG